MRYISDFLGAFALSLMVSLGCSEGGGEATGVLDQTFGVDGMVVHGGRGNDEGYDLTVAAGKILVVGRSLKAIENYDMVIWRYGADGTLDPSFGVDGIVVHDGAAGGSGDDYGYGITVDATGKIVVSGSSTNASNRDMVIWRYLSDGTLDPSFGVDGIVVHDGAVGENSSDYGYDLTLDAAGRIVVTGYGLMSGASSYHMVIWRYDSDGTLDPSFGDGGLVVYRGAAESSEGYAVKIDGTGKVVVAGSSYGPTRMLIWRYNSDGTLDPTFGDSGVVVSALPAYGHHLAIDSEGRILVAGSGGDSMVLWRYNADGSPDTSFGVDGFVAERGAAGGTRDEGWGLTIDDAGKILVVGQSRNANDNYDMVIWRYLSDGTLDPSFGVDGTAVHDGAVAGVDSGGAAIDIDAEAKILAAGYSYNSQGDWDMALWRYQ